MTTPPGSDKVPNLTKRWIRVLLSLTVSMAVGLAPYLGKVKVPLFATVLSLFPRSIADVSIVFSTAAMSFIAAFVQFRGSYRTPVADIDQQFRISTKRGAVLLGLLLILYFVTVTPVTYNGGADKDSFVTGFTGSKDARCAHVSSAQCIVTVAQSNEANIDALFGELQIRLAKALLVIVYVSFMSTFGYLAALIVLRGAATATAMADLGDTQLPSTVKQKA